MILINISTGNYLMDGILNGKNRHSIQRKVGGRVNQEVGRLRKIIFIAGQETYRYIYTP